MPKIKASIPSPGLLLTLREDGVFCVLVHMIRNEPSGSYRDWLPRLSLTCKHLASILRTPMFIREWNLRFAGHSPWRIPRENISLDPKDGVMVMPKDYQILADVNERGMVKAASILLSRCKRFVKVLYQRAEVHASAELFHGLRLVVPGSADPKYEGLHLFSDIDDFCRFAAVAMGVATFDRAPGVRDMFEPHKPKAWDMSSAMWALAEMEWSRISLECFRRDCECDFYILPWTSGEQGHQLYVRVCKMEDASGASSSVLVFSRLGYANNALVLQREYRGLLKCYNPVLHDAERGALYIFDSDRCELECYARRNVPSDVSLKDLAVGPDFNGRALNAFLDKFDLDAAQRLMPHGLPFLEARFHPNGRRLCEWVVVYLEQQDFDPEQDGMSAVSNADFYRLIQRSGIFDHWENVKAGVLVCNDMKTMCMIVDLRMGVLLAGMEELDDTEKFRALVVVPIIVHILAVWEEESESSQTIPLTTIVSLLSLVGKEIEERRRVIAMVEADERIARPFLCCIHTMPTLHTLKKLLKLVDMRAHYDHPKFMDFPFLACWVGYALDNEMGKGRKRSKKGVVNTTEANIQGVIMALVRAGYPLNALGRKSNTTVFGALVEQFAFDLAIWMLREFKYERLEPRIGMDASEWKFDFGEDGRRFEAAVKEFMNEDGVERYTNVYAFFASQPRVGMR